MPTAREIRIAQKVETRAAVLLLKRKNKNKTQQIINKHKIMPTSHSEKIFALPGKPFQLRQNMALT